MFVWDFDTGAVLRRFPDVHYDAHFLDEGKSFVHGYEQSLCLTDVDSGERLCALSGHFGMVRRVSPTWSGRYCLSHCFRPREKGVAVDATIRWWDLESRKELSCLVGHASSPECALILDAHHAVSASADGTVLFW
jgi:WD40 repeat protein